MPLNLREILKESRERLHRVLSHYDLIATGGTALFQWLEHPKAKEIYESCAKQGMLIRYFENQRANNKETMPSLRFGLPANEEQWAKLNNVLMTLSDLIKTTENNNEKNASYV